MKLLLIEGKQNEEVRRIMRDEADILAEQFIDTHYALSGIEGMASGLPVLANLDYELYTRLFRRYSYLNECPILSTSPETLQDNLRLLVTNPCLRENLGRAGRQYVEKYHSEKTAQYMFGAIYDKIWYGKELDLMNLFHPLMSEYNLRNPVQHPLIENKLPASYFIDVANVVS
jgi:glycosyltransferase involved in cell wall biosynthesis